MRLNVFFIAETKAEMGPFPVSLILKVLPLYKISAFIFSLSVFLEIGKFSKEVKVYGEFIFKYSFENNFQITSDVISKPLESNSLFVLLD